MTIRSAFLKAAITDHQKSRFFTALETCYLVILEVTGPGPRQGQVLSDNSWGKL